MKINALYTLLLVTAIIHGQSNISAKQNLEKKEEPTIYLNFENANLASVVNFLGKQKDINIIPNKNLENIKVSLSSYTPVTLENAWNELLTLLEANQLSLIEVDNIYRIVPSTQAKTQPLPLYMHSASELPDSDLLVRYAYLFKNIKPDNVRSILDQMLAPGSVHYNTNLNACLITEKSINIKTVMKIVQELDSGGLRESIKIIHLKEANAETLADFINKNLVGAQQDQLRLIQPLGKQETGYFSKNIKAIPDAYNNSLILLGTESGLQRIMNFVTKELDRPIEATQSRLHIKELKYTDAETLKPILDAIIKPPTRDSKSPIVGQVKYFEDMVIAAESSIEQKDEKSINVGSGNRLVIACGKDDWKRIENFIDKFDKPKPQVAFEILFVDVHTVTNHNLGAQLTTKRLNQIAKNVNGETQHLAGITPLQRNEMLVFGTPPQSSTDAGSPNTNVLVHGATFASAGKIGPNTTLWGIAQAVLDGESTNVISQPYLVASNHQKCSISISEQRNLPGQIDPSSTTAVQKTDKTPATTLVEIIPTINTDGLITLSITLKLDTFVNPYPTTATALSAEPSVGDRTTHHINTKATIADGEVLVIGGIKRTQTIDTINKTPILGDLPIIGNFFRSRTQMLEPSNLTIFIRPTLIKPAFEGGCDDYTQLKLDYSKNQIGRQTEFVSSTDPVQRWFFNTTQKSVDFKQIDEFTDGKYIPSSVMMSIDPYYQAETSRSVQRLERHRKRLLEKEKQQSAPPSQKKK